MYYGGGGTGGSEHAHPGRGLLESRQAGLVERGHRGKIGVRPGRADRQHFQFLRRYLVGDSDDRIEHEGHAARHHLGERRAVALERNVDHFRAGEVLEHRPGEVRRAAVARGRVAQLAGPRTGERDQVLHRIEAGLGTGHDDHRQHRGVAHRRKVLERVVADLAFHEDRVHEERERGEKQRIAIRRGPRHRLGRDDGVGAGPILDDEGLAERAGHVLRDDARDHVGRPARRETDQDPHRPRGIALRGRGARERARRRREDRKRFLHRSSRASG